VITLIAGFIHRKKLRGTCCGKRISVIVEPASEDTEKAEDKADDKVGRSDSQTTAALAIAAITKIATDHKHHGNS
jgi:xanthine/CO dehydrogenase XdhC/CoxF family maturation factor